jgi:hypothetical protein
MNADTFHTRFKQIVFIFIFFFEFTQYQWFKVLNFYYLIPQNDTNPIINIKVKKMNTTIFIS